MAGPAARGMYGVLRPGMEAEDSLVNRTMSGPGQVARNLGGSVLAGLLGTPGDLNAMFPKPLQGALPLPTSEQLQDKFGVEANRPESFVGLVGAPDPMDLARAGGKGLLAMTLFHGTPHKFDRFALDKIGTGEGAQAYGHGLYFAENPGVAKSYAPRDFDAEEVMMQRYKAAESVEDYESMEVWERAMMHDTADEIREIYRDTDYGAAMRDKAEAIASEVEQLAQQGTKGHLYEVDIPDEITDRMLDWDAPLSEQPESVQRALRELGVELPPGEMGSEVLDVDNKRRVLGRAGPGSEEAMSAALNEAGIPGIRYFDNQSRGAGGGRIEQIERSGQGFRAQVVTPDGGFRWSPELPTEKAAREWAENKIDSATRNIVVFNPDDITSVKRDGELVWENRSGIRPD